MARATPRRRLDLSSGEEEAGWTLVESKRRRRQRTPPTAPGHRLYRVVGQKEETTFHALRRLEREHPDLRVRVWERSGGETRVKPLDEDAAFFLARAAKEPAFGIRLAEVEGKSRGVVLRYPVAQSLDPILADPRVTFARRLTYSAGHGRREPTRQVEVTLRGALPESLDLGFWGVFSVRRFNPEPLRCFKCHAFGHVQKYCRQQAICGVCSGKHSTSQCIEALRAGVSRAARCPNCGKAHHAWSRACPARLRRLPPRPAREVLDISPLEPAEPKAAPRLASPPPVQKAVESSSLPTAPPVLQDAATQCVPPAIQDAPTQTCRKRKGRAVQTEARPAQEARHSQTTRTPTSHAATATETPAACDMQSQTVKTDVVLSVERLLEALTALESLSRHEQLHGQFFDLRETAVRRIFREVLHRLPLSRKYKPDDLLERQPDPNANSLI